MVESINKRVQVVKGMIRETESTEPLNDYDEAVLETRIGRLQSELWYLQSVQDTLASRLNLLRSFVETLDETVYNNWHAGYRGAQGDCMRNEIKFLEELLECTT